MVVGTRPEGEGRMEHDPKAQRSYRRAFWIAVIITVAAWLLPFGGLAIYPFSLLATWAHELGHGLGALISGGTFQRLEIFPGLSGLATTTSSGGAAQALVSVSGLVGAPLLGALVVAVGPRAGWARWILAAMAAVLAASVALWVRNPFGVIAVLALAAGCGLGAWRLTPWRQFILVQLVGIQLALSALRNWSYLFVDDVRIGGRLMPSDVGAVARVVGGPYWVWGALVLCFNLAVLYGAYRLALRYMRRGDRARAT
jgi:MFS family permease